MAYKDIDKVNGRTIRKLTSPDGTQCYGFLSGIKDDLGNLSELGRHMNLTEARNYCGFEQAETKKTLPKSAYAQNQKGYDPHGSNKVKSA